MNVKDRIKCHYEEILGEALKGTDIIQKNRAGKLTAKSRTAFNEEILKLYKPKSENKVIEWLDGSVYPYLDGKSKETLSLVASLATEKTLKLNPNNVTGVQIREIITRSIDKAKKILEKRHNQHVIYNLEVDDLQRGEAAFRELVNVDVPGVILDKTAEKIAEMVRGNPQKLVTFSEPCTVRCPQGKEIKTCELKSVSDALKFIEENPNKDGQINSNKSVGEPSKINRDFCK